MKIHVDFKSVHKILENASKDSRDYLFEYEVYDLIRNIGSETLPDTYFIRTGERLDENKLASIPGEKVVVKVVSPYVLHKSDVGGVAIVSNQPQEALSVVRKMKVDVPEKFAALIKKNPEYTPLVYRGIDREELISAISKDISGFLFCRFMAPDSNEFGSELFVSIRRTREFGMVINAGLGGTYTELYAKRFKKGQAVVAASTLMTDGSTFFELFKNTISYKKLAGLTRGQKRIVTDGQLLECFSAFIALANNFSPSNPEAAFVIEELEINPFAFTNYLMVPLDGLCCFSLPQKPAAPRPVERIDNLLHPSSIGVIGASAKEKNLGRIIVKNILESGFDISKLMVIHPKASKIDGVKALPAINKVKEKIDLLIIAVSAQDVPKLVDEVIKSDAAKSVLLIPGGMGEKKGNEKIRQALKKKIEKSHRRPKHGPVFLGENSLGILSNPGRLDALFIPDVKLPKHRGDHIRKTALISQSGAYMITRMSKLSFLDPAYAISIGNQIDLTASDIMQFLNTQDDIKIVACYMEGFSDLDGLAFAKAVQEAVCLGKQVLFYKAGRTPEGKSATSGHTASLAGNYMVCESCVSQAGAIVAKTFTGFEGLLRLSCTLDNKEISGNRLAAVSNAGYESVGIADNILGEDFKLEMALLSSKTVQKLKKVLKKANLDTLTDIKNPMDVTPMAKEAVYESVIKALLEDPNVDAVIAAIVPLTPVLHTLSKEKSPAKAFASENNIAKLIPNLAARFKKPLVMVVDSGPLYDPLADALQQGGLPVFRSADQAVWVLGKYIQGRMKAKGK